MSAWACGSALQLGLQALEDRDRLARSHLHDGLLPLARATGREAAALRLRRHGGGADLDHRDGEQRLDGLLDLRLVGVLVDAERVLVGRRQDVGLLGDDRADDHLARFHHSTSAFERVVAVARAVSASTAAWEATSVAGRTMSATPASSAASTSTPSRLRNDLAAFASSCASTTSVEPERRSASSPAACLVDGASKAPASTPKTDSRSACSESAERSAARRALRLTLRT